MDLSHRGENGCVMLTRSIFEFDLLMQLDTRGQAIFYDAL